MKKEKLSAQERHRLWNYAIAAVLSGHVVARPPDDDRNDLEVMYAYLKSHAEQHGRTAVQRFAALDELVDFDPHPPRQEP